MFGFFQRQSNVSSVPAANLRLESLESRITPALQAVQDIYSVQLGHVLSVSTNINPDGTITNHGLLYNDVSLDNPGYVISATYVANTLAYVDSAGKVLSKKPPSTSLQGTLGQTSPAVNPDGSFTFVAPAVVPSNAVAVTFQYQAEDALPETAIGNVTIKLIRPNNSLVAVGADAGAGPQVTVYQAGTAVVKYNFFPYETTFTGGVQVAIGDLNNDGIPDIVTVPSAGGGPRLEIFDGANGQKIIDQFIFDPGFRGGGTVAIGDFLGTGLNQIAVGAGVGGGPRVTIFQLTGGQLTQVANFFAFNPAQSGGVRIALGDLNGVGRSFLIAAPGPGASPVVNVFDAVSTIGAPGPTAPPVLSFTAGNAANTAGLFVAAGDFNGSGADQILIGSGSGAATVSIYSNQGGLLSNYDVPATQGITLQGGTNGTSGGNGAGIGYSTTPNGSLLNTQPNTPNTSSASTSASGVPIIQGGARVAAVDWTGTGIDAIVVGNGPGNAPVYQVFNPIDLTELSSTQVFSSNFLGGVNVGAGSGV